MAAHSTTKLAPKTENQNPFSTINYARMQSLFKIIRKLLLNTQYCLYRLFIKKSACMQIENASVWGSRHQVV